MIQFDVRIFLKWVGSVNHQKMKKLEGDWHQPPQLLSLDLSFTMINTTNCPALTVTKETHPVNTAHG